MPLSEGRRKEALAGKGKKDWMVYGSFWGGVGALDWPPLTRPQLV